MKKLVEIAPFMISGHHVLGEILRRNKFRDDCARVARLLGIPSRNKRIHRAALGPSENVESNLPIPQSAISDPKLQ